MLSAYTFVCYGNKCLHLEKSLLYCCTLWRKAEFLIVCVLTWENLIEVNKKK